MTNEATFAVEAALRRHFERERDSQFGLTLRALIASDARRLECWDGNLTADDFELQRRLASGDTERVVIESAQRDGTLTPCIGYALTDLQYRPEESAWLLREGNIIGPSLGDVLGFLGVALRASETANWTPSQPHAVAERSVGGLRVG